MTNNVAWWNLPIEELEQMADDKGNIKLNTKIKATNPYSGQSAMLTPENISYTLRSRNMREMKIITMQKKLSKFSRMNASAYMTLLD